MRGCSSSWLLLALALAACDVPFAAYGPGADAGLDAALAPDAEAPTADAGSSPDAAAAPDAEAPADAALPGEDAGTPADAAWRPDAAAGPDASAWVQSLAATTQCSVLDLALDSEGRAYVTGSFTGTVDLGDGPQTAANQTLFVASYRTGMRYRWARTVPSSGISYGTALVANAADQVLVTGVASGVVQFPAGAQDAGGRQKVVGLLLEDDGEELWHRLWGRNSNCQGRGVGAGLLGEYAVAGLYSDTADFGGGPLPSTSFDNGFLTVLDAGPLFRFQRAFTASGDVYVDSVVLDNLGQVYAAGRFQAATDFGGGVVSTAGARDGFVVALSAANQFRWVRRVGSGGADFVLDLDMAPEGHVLAACEVGGDLDFGLGPSTSLGGPDACAVRYDADGTVVWAVRLGGGGADRATRIATGPGGTAVVAGYYHGDASFGGLPLSPAGGADGFVAGLDAAGHALWARRFASNGEDSVNGLAVDRSTGRVWVAGTHGGPMTLDGQTLTPAGTSAGFVYSFLP